MTEKGGVKSGDAERGGEKDEKHSERESCSVTEAEAAVTATARSFPTGG